MPDVDFNLYLITDRHHLPEDTDLLGQIEAALVGGVRCVQLREKDLTSDDLLPLAMELRLMTQAFDAQLIINDKIDLVKAVDADGVHLGDHSVTAAEARKQLGWGKLIGVSTHQPAEVETAAEQGADFVTFGPVYVTPSKLPYGDPVGTAQLQAACAVDLPVFALGGVTPERVPELIEAGCTRAACIGAILHAADPAAASREFLAALDKPIR